LEAEVLATLWAAEAALTAADVQQRLGTGLAYSTVVTILSRLFTKGTLEREHQGRAYAYRPVADEPGLAARRMLRVPASATACWFRPWSAAGGRVAGGMIHLSPR
jgi:predicted transcriptional regulator